MSTEDLVGAIARQFAEYPPTNLEKPVNAYLASSFPDGVDIDVIVDVMVDEAAAEVRTAASASFLRWDAESAAPWAAGTLPNSTERRELIYESLDIPEEAYGPLTSIYPVQGVVTVIAALQPWAPWYTPNRRKEHDFYWRAYRRALTDKGWDGETVGKLDVATTEVVQRLADPTRDEPYQAKGLVVGYVQSGKTANFTGVVAKAMDAGYRLIIVLTGTIELLRGQTQRRLDMELVGRQNIGTDGDYENDADWIDGKFLEHELDPNTSNDVPTIRRLTGSSYDYKTLGKGISALQFEVSDHSLPLNNPKNLYHSNIRVAVVKKNSTVLKKLVADLKRVHNDKGQIPTLIIDDEADQASVNTVKQKDTQAKEVERTAINGQIAELLGLLKRAQYIGYTATPFANVFVAPDDSVNIFPSDFIVSLERPKPYMGGIDFHDFDSEFIDDDRTPANSNKAAFVRDLRAESDEDRTEEQLRALDSFVLSGAIKLYRESKGAKPYRHHTMLVHESVRTAQHKALADEFKVLWSTAGYSQASSLVRLEKLWTTDFAVVSAARPEPGVESPGTFEALEDFIGAAYSKISEGVSPVIVVNGEVPDENEQEALDFDERGVWKILVGGTKLSRGFTVEGLTITHYTRRTPQADTLMQMGRWFGFRPGYRDLVRLFIGRNVPGPAGADYDMYKAFEAIVRDEEDFRAELARYRGLNSSDEPMVVPRDVPPMVFQQLPWLKPTSGNKMYNAELAYRGVGGQSFSFTMQPPRGDGAVNKRHFEAVHPLLSSLGNENEFEMDGSRGMRQSFRARWGIVSAKTVLDVVTQFVWDENWSFEPHLAAMDRAIKGGLLVDFAILLPQPKSRLPLPVKGWDEPLPVVNRKRLDAEYRTGFTGTAVRERDAIEHIACSPLKDGGPQAKKLRKKTRGGLILVFANDPEEGSKNMKRARVGTIDPGDIATLFSYALPYAADPSPRVGFRVKQPSADAIVDANYGNTK